MHTRTSLGTVRVPTSAVLHSPRTAAPQAVPAAAHPRRAATTREGLGGGGAGQVTKRGLYKRLQVQSFAALYLPISPCISLYLPTSPYISLHLPSSAHQVLLRLSSYFGGLLCIAWSHDDRLLFTGGEDDLVSRVGVRG